MANATFHTDTFTFPEEYRVSGASDTVYLRYLKVNHRDIRLRYLANGETVKNSGYYGVNGTYNDMGPNLVGIAIDSGEYIRSSSKVGYNGEQNRNPAIECGTFAVLDQPTNGVALLTDDIATYHNHIYTVGSAQITLTKENALMAIGGTSLYPSEELTQSEFINRIKTQDPGGGASGIAARTAIIYIGGSWTGLNTVLLTVHSDANESSVYDDGITFWQLRYLINTYFGAQTPSGVGPIVHAIALDGGRSTQIAYKKADGTTGAYQVEGDRPARSMLCVPM